MSELWAGTDAGKAAHHCTVIDTDGTKVLSRRVPNNEPDLLDLIGDVLALAEDSPVTWAVDLNADGGALLIALLAGHGQRLLHAPGRTVHHASRGYRGDGKTDAKDAYVIADQARMRRDLQPLQEWDEIAVDLKILTARRYDLAADRTRAINRMRAQLLEYFPALERTFDYAASKAALILLTGYQTPVGLRRIGPSRLATWLKNRKVRGAQAIADAAVAAAQAQHTAVAGESTAAAVVNTLARTVLALDEEIAAIDARIAARFREHRDAEVLLSMPGMGPLLGQSSSPAATWTPSAPRDVSPELLASHPSHGIQVASAATCAGHTATTADSFASSTYPPRSPPASAQRPRPSTTENELRARATNRRSSPSPAAASTSCGPSSGTNATTQPSHRPWKPLPHDARDSLWISEAIRSTLTIVGGPGCRSASDPGLRSSYRRRHGIDQAVQVGPTAAGGGRVSRDGGSGCSLAGARRHTGHE